VARRAGGVALATEFKAADRLEAQLMRSQALNAYLTTLALRIEREARKRAPVDTGRLRNSITHRVYPEGSRRLVAEVGTNVEYAAAQEFGTSRGVPPTRFLGGALEAVARQLTTRRRL
jgi:phage gpG-like protein